MSDSTRDRIVALNHRRLSVVSVYALDGKELRHLMELFKYFFF